MAATSYQEDPEFCLELTEVESSLLSVPLPDDNSPKIKLSNSHFTFHTWLKLKRPSTNNCSEADSSTNNCSAADSSTNNCSAADISPNNCSTADSSTNNCSTAVSSTNNCSAAVSSTNNCSETYISPNSEPQSRQLFHTMTSLGNGFEAFFTAENHLIVATCSCGKYNFRSVTRMIGNSIFYDIPEYHMSVDQWHMLDIVFERNWRNPEQTTLKSSNAVTVFMDGCAIFTDYIPYPSLSDESPVVILHIGGCENKLKNGVWDKIHNSTVTLQSFTGETMLTAISRWGKWTSFQGQIVCVAGINSKLSPDSIKMLFRKGVNNLGYLSTIDPNNIVFYYHAKALCANECRNLVPLQLSNRPLRYTHAEVKNITFLSKYETSDTIPSDSNTENDGIRHWKMSFVENKYRQRPKLDENQRFNPYNEAVRLRDLNNMESSTDERLVDLRMFRSPSVVYTSIAEGVGEVEDDSDEHASQSTHQTYFCVECDLITFVDSLNGQLELTSTHLTFYTTNASTNESQVHYKWENDKPREVHLRRYILRPTAIEIFLNDNSNYFFNFNRNANFYSERDSVYQKIRKYIPRIISVAFMTPSKMLQNANLTQKWRRWEISNFDYIMQLNTIAGRTYNDLNQYPIFPWVIADYTSASIDLDTDDPVPGLYRDLSLPIGIVNSSLIPEIKEKYEDSGDDETFESMRFHFGQYYSHSECVAHYMLRVEPFTKIHIDLHDGKFDKGNRQFCSIPDTWSDIWKDPRENRELIPEFFYFPDFLRNDNGYNLGVFSDSNKPVNDVILPLWAEGSAEVFIYNNRKALESDYVSRHLHNWIDLIFGCKQRGPGAIEACNVYDYVLYEGSVDLDKIEDENIKKCMVNKIKYFGQIKAQLLEVKHEPRMTRTELLNYHEKILRNVPIFSRLNCLHQLHYDLSKLKQDYPLVYIAVPPNQPVEFMNGLQISLITVSKLGFVGRHKWMSFSESEEMGHFFGTNGKHKFLGPLMPGLRVSANLYATSPDAKFLYAAGQWDNSLTICQFKGNDMVITRENTMHLSVLTCLAYNTVTSEPQLITGSRSATCIIWSLQDPAKPEPLKMLQGHQSPITCVALSTDLDLAISGSEDGLVVVYAAKSGKVMHKITLSNSIILDMSISIGGNIILHWEMEPKSSKRHYYSRYSINGRLIRRDQLCDSSDKITCMSFLPESRVIACTKSGKLICTDGFERKSFGEICLKKSIEAVCMVDGMGHLLTALNDGQFVVTCVEASDRR